MLKNLSLLEKITDFLKNFLNLLSSHSHCQGTIHAKMKLIK